MKKILIACALSIGIVATVTSQAGISNSTGSGNLALSSDSDSPQKIVTFKNDSSHKVDLCILYMDSELNSWVTVVIGLFQKAKNED